MDVKKLPGGLDFVYDPLKSKISGGQLQRLVIARAMLRDKPIWLFDEATSAIDSQAEKGIIAVLQGLKTRDSLSILFVTHRMEYLPMFDEVWFVNHGRILAKGSHEEMKQNSTYENFIRGF